MFGQKIGYKLLENQLNQMWAWMHIVDLGQEFYLVTFTSEENYTFAIMEELSMIYDHYLADREWCVNFPPKSDDIKQLACKSLGSP